MQEKTGLTGISAATANTTPSANGELARFQGMIGMGCIVAAVVHVCFLAAFLWLGETALSIFNVFSVALFVFAYTRVRKPPLWLPVALVWGEIIVHQTWVTIVFGLGSGFVFYLLTLVVGGFLIPMRSTAFRLSMSGLPFLITIALLVVFQDGSALRPPGEVLEIILRIGNFIGVAFSLTFIVVGYARAAATAENALEAAHRESESLLAKILPRPVAERLKRNPGIIADSFDDVSILFADLVAFTRIAERTPPETLVRQLDTLVQAFDRQAAHHGVEKIKTVGDGWIGACGLPVPQADHAERMAAFARSMLDELAQTNAALGTDFQLRIGVATGPVVAGVIGNDKFAYDLWGDAVNLAARLESTGLPGEIQMDRTTMVRLESCYGFEPRGTINIKGKGEVETYLLRRRHDVGTVATP